MPDMLTSLNELGKLAPHNVLAAVLSGGQLTLLSQKQVSQEEEKKQEEKPPISQATPYRQQVSYGGLGSFQGGSQQQGQGQWAGQQQPAQQAGTGGGGTAPPGGVALIGAPGPVAETTRGPERPLTFPPQATVKVIDKDTKLPVVGAAVYYDSVPVGITDSKGKFATNEIPAGRHTLSVDAIGYDVAEKEISMPAPSRSPQSFNYDFEVSYIEMPGEAPVEVPAPTEPVTVPAYEYPSYGAGAPVYEAPSYGGPTYGAPQQPAQPALPALPALPTLPQLLPIEYFQQLFMLPFIPAQMALGSLPRGGRCR
jgi:hypothetical protein